MTPPGNSINDNIIKSYWKTGAISRANKFKIILSRFQLLEKFAFCITNYAKSSVKLLKPHDAQASDEK